MLFFVSSRLRLTETGFKILLSEDFLSVLIGLVFACLVRLILTRLAKFAFQRRLFFFEDLVV